MSTLGVVGALLGLLALFFSPLQKSEKRLIIFGLAYLAHIACSIVYYQWTLSNLVDTSGYYYDPNDFYHRGFQLNTYVIIWIVQFLKENFYGTYLDFFLLFQSFGFWGIALLLRVFEELYVDLNIPQPNWTYALAFLPGMHFWTSMIGKDALLFLASTLILWATMRIRRRFAWFLLALAIMLVIRPHIGLVAIMALAGSAIFGLHVRAWTRLALVAAAVGASAIVVVVLPYSFNVDLRSATSVMDFLSAQSEITYRVMPGESLIDLPYPVRILSFLFRPFFFDARDMFGLIASFENLVLLAITAWTCTRPGILRAIFRHAFFIRFALFFVVGTTLLLAYLYYNVGLGLRQRTMIMPGMLTLFISVIAVRQAQRSSVAVGSANHSPATEHPGKHLGAVGLPQ